MKEAVAYKTGFKPSPLGPIPLDWEIKKLGTLAIKIGSGITPTGGAQVYKKEGRPFLRSQNVGWGNLLLDDVVFIDEKMHETFSSTEIKENDVLLNITGASIGRSALADKRIINGNVNQHVCIIRPKAQELTPQFLSSFLLSTIGQNLIDSFQAGGNREGLNFEQIKSFPIPLPPVNEQRTISGLLNTWDKAIEKTTQLITAKEQRKKWLRQQLLTGKKRLKGFTGKWEEVKLSDVFDRVARRNTELNSTVVTISAQKGFISQGDYFNKIVASDILDNYFLVHKGEFCYNKSYSNGYPWGATKRLNDFDKAVVTTLYICFGIKDYKKHSGEFFEHFFESGILDEGLMKIAHEGGRAHGLLNVTPTDFLNLKITIPSFEEQTAIANILQTADKEINLIKQELDAYKEQKKGLMRVLLMGKIRLKF